MTPEREAACALDFDVSRDDLKLDVQVEYDQQLEARRSQVRPTGPDAIFPALGVRCAANPRKATPRHWVRQHSACSLVLGPG